MGVCSPEQLKYTGIDQWRKAGYTGKGVTVWCSEPKNSDHGANSAQLIKDIAPDVILLTGTISKTIKGTNFVSCSVRDEQDNNKMIPLEDFIAKYRPSIVSSSNYGADNVAWTDYVKNLQARYDFTIFNSAANNGDDEDHESIACRFPVECVIAMGALGWNGGSPVRPPYSSVGKELDFAQLVMWWSGTSAAAPVQAGITAMIMQRYGHMSQREVIKYLSMIAKDLQSPGHDIYTGWGQPLLPLLTKKYITMTTKDEIYLVDGELNKMDTKPVNKEGVVFVPIRVISESLNKKVDATFNNDKSIKVTITEKEGFPNVIELNTNSDLMFVNGKKILLDFPPYIDSENRCLVPVRAITEAFGCKVDWIQQESKVMIFG